MLTAGAVNVVGGDAVCAGSDASDCEASLVSITVAALTAGSMVDILRESAESSAKTLTVSVAARAAAADALASVASCSEGTLGRLRIEILRESAETESTAESTAEALAESIRTLAAGQPVDTLMALDASGGSMHGTDWPKSSGTHMEVGATVLPMRLVSSDASKGGVGDVDAEAGRTSTMERRRSGISDAMGADAGALANEASEGRLDEARSKPGVVSGTAMMSLLLERDVPRNFGSADSPPLTASLVAPSFVGLEVLVGGGDLMPREKLGMRAMLGALRLGSAGTVRGGNGSR